MFAHNIQDKVTFLNAFLQDSTYQHQFIRLLFIYFLNKNTF